MINFFFVIEKMKSLSSKSYLYLLLVIYKFIILFTALQANNVPSLTNQLLNIRTYATLSFITENNFFVLRSDRQQVFLLKNKYVFSVRLY